MIRGYSRALPINAIRRVNQYENRTYKMQYLFAPLIFSLTLNDVMNPYSGPHTSVYRQIYSFIKEPIATFFRLLHLIVLFLPLLVSFPLTLFGPTSSALYWYKYVVWTMERAGPTFVKLGQWAASRHDLFPTPLCLQLAKLHSMNRPHTIAATQRTLKYGNPKVDYSECFDEFNQTPIGVGAIAQVYHASLADNSVEVAVKVLHPNAKKTIQRDLVIMKIFASVINCLPTMKWLNFPDEVATFSEMMKLQLDLSIEAKNLSKFVDNFKDNEAQYKFPAVLEDYSGARVLVEEFMHGIPMEKLLRFGAGPFRERIADGGLNAFLQMLLIDNFIHADLHPGNMIVRFNKPSWLTKLFGHEPVMPQETLERLAKCDDKNEWDGLLKELHNEGYHPQIAFIDAGLVTTLNEVNRKNFIDLFSAIAEFDGYRAGLLMVERSKDPSTVIDAEVFALRMQNLLLVLKQHTFALGNVKIGDILSQAMAMVRRHHIHLEGDFANVVISILLLEGVGRQLDPELDLFKNALPILRKLSDKSVLKVWLALELRNFASSFDVDKMIKYDLLSPNI